MCGYQYRLYMENFNNSEKLYVDGSAIWLLSESVALGGILV